MARKPKKTDVDDELAAAADAIAVTERTLEDARAANAAAHARYRDADEAWQTQDAERRRAEHDGEPGPAQSIGA